MPEDNEGSDAPQEGAEDKGSKPPWGSDENFDPGKAWKLIENLRNENNGIKTERDQYKTKVTERDDAEKTETQKLNEQLTAARDEGGKSASLALRYEVALDKGLTRRQAMRLVGATKEELEADADDLLADLGDAPKPGPSTRPREHLRGGGDPTEDVDETDPRKLAAQVRGS